MRTEAAVSALRSRINSGYLENKAKCTSGAYLVTFLLCRRYGADRGQGKMIFTLAISGASKAKQSRAAAAFSLPPYNDHRSGRRSKDPCQKA